MAHHDLVELDVNYAEFHLRLRRGEAVVVVPSASVEGPPPQLPAPAPGAVSSRGTTIKSPLAGIFYRAPSPGAPPFAHEGEVVAAGQTVCIIEAMKLMNEIGAEVPCRIRQILVANAAVVESGQDLMVVEEL
jgi:acetyl-CoA carboxylase biotin carboxyl carrier protein